MFAIVFLCDNYLHMYQQFGVTPNEMLSFSLVLFVGLTAKWWLQSALLSVHNRQSRIIYSNCLLLDPKIQIFTFGLSDHFL